MARRPPPKGYLLPGDAGLRTGGESRAARRVFGVGDDEIDPLLDSQAGYGTDDDLPARLTNNVSDQQ